MTPQVLVVGAGPTGLTMAIELARRGVDVRIVDALPEPTTETRALGIQPRTLELFDRIGIADDATDQGLQVDRFTVLSEDKPLLRLNLSTLDSPHPYMVMLPQDRTENLLTVHLAASGIQVQRGVELLTLTQLPSHVEATLRLPNGTTEQITANYLVGCDGAHSTVRHQLSIPFAGSSFEENFVVADLRMDWPLPADQLFAYLNRGRFVAYFPMTGGMYRVAIAYPKDRLPTGPVSIEELQAAVDQCAPVGSRVVEARQGRRFQINQRGVARHTIDRVFLAGDAAHIHSVVGAQGMNTGIQDAFNLGWKLAAVLHKQADPTLLNTYETERGPVARRLVRGTRTITRMTLLSHPVTTALRRNVASRVLSRPHMRTILARAVSQIDVSYRSSAGASRKGTPTLGDRAPDVQIPGSTRVPTLFDALDRTRHSLVILGPVNPELDSILEEHHSSIRIVHVIDEHAPASPNADTVINDHRGVISLRYGIMPPGYILIRPDGYIAGRQTDEDHHDLRDYLHRTVRRNDSSEKYSE